MIVSAGGIEIEDVMSRQSDKKSFQHYVIQRCRDAKYLQRRPVGFEWTSIPLLATSLDAGMVISIMAELPDNAPYEVVEVTVSRTERYLLPSEIALLTNAPDGVVP